MKKISSLIAILLCAVTLFAQAPEKFTYQAVVRNASNSLVANAQVGVRMNILQGSASGNAVYSESHMATTNANGLITVNIGGGSVLHGIFASIDWANGPYFLKTDIDPNGGNDYSITSVQQLLSVPYALYAKDAGNGFSGDYNDLVNVPQIPQIPADISAFNNDAGYITSYTETDPQYNAWDKDYNDLINKPTIPTVPTNVSAFTNDAGYITSAAIPAMPTNVSAFTNDAGYVTAADVQQAAGVPTNVSAFNNDMGYLTSYTETDPLFTSWGKNYNTLNNKPNLATVATSGNYNDLSNKPTIPTNVSAFTNDAGYITATQVPEQVNADWNATSGKAKILNKPTIPTVPSNVSAFTNDAGYLTSYTEQQVLSISNDTIFITGGSFVKLPEGFSGSWNDLTDKPENISVPDSVSAFVNDAGYITMDSVPTIPTNVSVFENDAHYITDVQLQQIMSTIFTMQNTIDSMGLVIEALYNQINLPDSTQEMTDTSLQVTFTTTGYTNEPTVHQSDLSGTTFFQNYATVNGLTGNVNEWWIFESNRKSQLHSTYVYTNKTITSFSLLKWNIGVWQPVPIDNSHFRLDENDPTHKTIIFEYYNEDDESWQLERALYAIKFND